MKITSEEIRKLGETQKVEFKKSLLLIKDALIALCSMINTEDRGGCVIFGVEPDLSICGIDPGNYDSAQKSLVQQIRQKFDPPIICSIKLAECEDKTLLILSATRSKEQAYHEYDGRVFIREGTCRRQLSFLEKEQLSKRRNRDKYNGPWKCDRCNSISSIISTIEITSEGPKKSYKCGCGGEYWPL